jgi:hypothetical protein
LNIRFKRRGNEGKARIIGIKIRNRKRMLRIRLSDYNNDYELVQEFKNIQRNKQVS